MSVACGDCGLPFDGPREDHLAVCEAHTCQCCERVFDCVITENQHNERVCAGCQRDLDEVDMEYSSDEDMEGGD